MPPDADREKLRILVIATQKTAVAARISLALMDVGFCVAAVTPRGHPVRHTRKIRYHFAHHRRSYLKSITRAIGRWSPDILICTDDLAVRQLQALHQRMVASEDPAQRAISELIELSLGPVVSFSAIRDKSVFLAQAELEGLRCPRTIVFPAGYSLASFPADLHYPIVVKADRSYGGIGVRVVNSIRDARAAIWELQIPSMWRGIFRRFFGAMLGSKFLASFMFPLRRTISLQRFIPGRPSNRAVICWKGEVLAGISVEVVEVKHDAGPASVIRVVDHPEMAKFAKHMVGRLGLSGFVGFDFILDSLNQAWLIEMNPRVTPISHFSLADGTNLPASLYAHITGLQPRPTNVSINCDLIALFPDEIIREPSSEYVQSCHHDVPWREPGLVRCLLNQALQRGIRKRICVLLERYTRRGRVTVAP